MSEKTYIELCKNDLPTVQISIWTDQGIPFSPSAAHFTVKGSKKDNTLMPRSDATVKNNTVYAQISRTVTASAAEYDIYWELHKSGGDEANHCTKVLVIDTC